LNTVTSHRDSLRRRWLPFVLFLTAATPGLRVARADDTVPDPWKGQDIGAPVMPGKAAADANGVYTITAGGADIWGDTDHFHYVYQPVNGDFTVVLRAVSITHADDWSKGGPMVRETLDAGSNFAALELTPSNGVSYQYRNADNTQCNADAGTGATSAWLKLVRKGTVVDAYQAPDNNGAPGDWTQVGGDQKIKNGSVYVGIATVAHSDAGTTTFVADKLSLTKN